MSSTHLPMVALACALVTDLGAAGCRRARPPTPAPTPDAAARTEAGGQPELGAPPVSEADWLGLSDEEVASRSGITLEECRLALAEGEGIRITVCDFIREINSLPPRRRAHYDSLERRKGLLDDMISLAVMEQEAKRLGLDRAPETQFYIERLLADKVEAELKAELRKEIREGITPADEEQFYAANHEQFNRPELASAAHILVATEAEARELIARLTAPDAERNLFAALAAERSLDTETKNQGGSLSSFTRPGVHSDRYPSVDPALAAAAFEMQNIGDIYPEPVRTDRGYHVLRLTGKRAAVSRTLDQVRHSVRAQIEEQRLREAWNRKLEEIKAQLGVELHPENLAHVRPTLPSQEELERAHHHHHHIHGPPPPPGLPPRPAWPPRPVPGPSSPPVPVPSPLPPGASP